MNQCRNIWPVFFIWDDVKKDFKSQLIDQSCVFVNDAMFYVVDSNGKFCPLNSVKHSVFGGLIVSREQPSHDTLVEKSILFLREKQDNLNTVRAIFEERENQTMGTSKKKTKRRGKKNSKKIAKKAPPKKDMRTKTVKKKVSKRAASTRSDT